MTAFHNFAKAIQQRFEQLSQHELFVTNPDKDALWSAYLNTFPKGTNPIFRERTEHDCSCCRQFIKNLANVVALVDGKLLTLWDNPEAFEYPYDVVATALREFTRGHPISGLFRAELPQYGAVSNIERLEDGSTREWKHLHGNVLRRHQAVSDSAAQQGQYATSVAMFKRALGLSVDEHGNPQKGLTPYAFKTVLELIDNNSLYRGAEFRASVQAFYDLGQQFVKTPLGEASDVFLWTTAANPVVRIRNTSIGSLLDDLSNGVPLEQAVIAYEKKVAPENYKRSSALITPRMIDDAMQTVNSLGLRDALDRRFATLKDVSVNDVLWVDNGVRSQMKDSLVEGLLAAAVPAVNAKAEAQAIPVSIDAFMSLILPQASEIKALVKNVQQGNLMSLTAPVHVDSGQLFKWGNDFAWSYKGNLTDSIKEKVKAAGGNTNAALRISLGWFNGDDLDLHVIQPDGKRIYFGYKDGKLDVDMNAGGPRNSTDPVENISFTRPQDGTYKVLINQFALRSRDNPGFVIELEADGQVQQFSYRKPLANKTTLIVGDLVYRDGRIVEVKFDSDVVGGSQPTAVWGITTETFVPVSTVLLSPNHWHGQAIGNKHYLFILEGCASDEPARGIYNEYLIPALDKHRKVFEVLASKTLCPVVPEQLSGLGFSETKRDTLTVQVTLGNQRKTYAISFGASA